MLRHCTRHVFHKNIHIFSNIRSLEKIKYTSSRESNLDTRVIFFFPNWSIVKMFRSIIQILMQIVKFRSENTMFVTF